RVSDFRHSSFGFRHSYMILLQAANSQLAFLQGTDPIGAGERGSHSSHDGDLRGERGISNHHFVLAWNFSAWRVDDERDVAVLDAIENVRASLMNLENLCDFDFRF